MFILVNHSSDYGMNHCGNFDTCKEAWEYIASSIDDDYSEYYGEDFDLMSMYPFHNDEKCERYNDGDTQIFAGYNWCNCYARNYEDKWIIIEA